MTHRTTPRSWPLAFLAVFAVACGGHSSHADDDDPRGGGGGTALGDGTGGTGNGNAPTPAAIGLSLTLSPPQALPTVDINGRSCTAGGTGEQTYTIGAPAPNRTLENGTDGATVNCTVRADGSFTLEAAGVDSTTKQRLALNFAGSAESQTASTGSIQFYSPDTGALYTTSPYPDCTVGPATIVKTGALLTDFSCPIIVAEDPSSGCAAKGTLAVEYCRTGEEEL